MSGIIYVKPCPQWDENGRTRQDMQKHINWMIITFSTISPDSIYYQETGVLIIHKDHSGYNA